MADTQEVCPAILLDQLASLDPQERLCCPGIRGMR